MSFRLAHTRVWPIAAAIAFLLFPNVSSANDQDDCKSRIEFAHSLQRDFDLFWQAIEDCVWQAPPVSATVADYAKSFAFVSSNKISTVKTVGSALSNAKQCPCNPKPGIQWPVVQPADPTDPLKVQVPSYLEFTYDETNGLLAPKSDMFIYVPRQFTDPTTTQTLYDNLGSAVTFDQRTNALRFDGWTAQSQ